MEKSNGSSYLVRLPGTDIAADGLSKIPVVAIGTLADGSPSSEEIVLGLTRENAGLLDSTQYILHPTGISGFLTPCDASLHPDCLGPFQVTLALASDPHTIVATSQTSNLVKQTGVGSMAPCQRGRNVLFLDGATAQTSDMTNYVQGDYIHPGKDTILNAKWSATVSDGTLPGTVTIRVIPANEKQGSNWDLTFSSYSPGEPLRPRIYDDATRYPFSKWEMMHPGFDISGDGRGCNKLSGSFEIHELVVEVSTLVSFGATFKQSCDNRPPLLGCVYYEKP